MGSPRAVVSDQLKSGVTLASRYEPGIQRTYEELSQHYGDDDLAGAAGPSARQGEGRRRRADRPALDPRAPAQQDVLLPRRAQRAHRRAGRGLNARPMRLYRASRHALFTQLDQPALRPLPAEPFVYGEWTINARVNIFCGVPPYVAWPGGASLVGPFLQDETPHN